MFLDRKDYDTLASIVFRPEYPGYKPNVQELPNGDGKVDVKRYAHIAPKYLPGFGSGRDRVLLLRALIRAHEVAEAVYDALGGPQAFRPDIRYGALRVLSYPANTGMSHRHTDFDLFTIPLFRDQPESFVRYFAEGADSFEQSEAFKIADEMAPGVHLGELGQAIGLGPATPHEVLAHAEGQLSAVYFAIPNWDAKMPGFNSNEQMTVKSWLNERMARSRTAFTNYK